MNKLDMNVDCETISRMKADLKIIGTNLANSAECMNGSIEKSEQLLSGKQFERAKEITNECIGIAKTDVVVIKSLLKYLDAIEDCLNKYMDCSYGNE